MRLSLIRTVLGGLARDPQLAAERLADHISHTARLLISCAHDEHLYSSERAS